MKNEDVRRAYDEVLPDLEDKARMLNNILLAASDARPERTEIQVLKKKSTKRGAMLIIAAALALALSMTVLAYTTNLFGFRALQVPEPEGGYEPNPWISEDATRISITQPQDVPDDVYDDIGTEVAEGINEKLENSRLAWNEWKEWQSGIVDPIYDEFEALYEKYHFGDYDSAKLVDHDDGSGTIEFYTYVGDFNPYDPEAYELITTMEITAEDLKRYDELSQLMMEGHSYDSGYDFNYGLTSDEDKAKLEEIAAKYGLNLRKYMTLMWSSETAGMEGDGFHTNEEIVDILSDAACSGRMFYNTPSGFDKVYYYDEGTFSVVWYADMPNRDEKAYCYSYNSVYSTLSSGNEIESYVEDADSFMSRKHACPDGTEVTILSNGGSNAYIYVYLENSFFVVHIEGESIQLDNVNVYNGSFTDADLDYIADSINYSVIGK